jgi:putative NADPH-quinone reductase
MADDHRSRRKSLCMSNILLIDGYPDPDRGRFVHALADAYADGAASTGHNVHRMDIPMLHTRAEWRENMRKHGAAGD